MNGWSWVVSFAPGGSIEACRGVQCHSRLHCHCPMEVPWVEGKNAWIALHEFPEVSGSSTFHPTQPWIPIWQTKTPREHTRDTLSEGKRNGHFSPFLLSLSLISCKLLALSCLCHFHKRAISMGHFQVPFFIPKPTVSNCPQLLCKATSPAPFTAPSPPHRARR
jgi:hypothetical protein